MKIFKSVLLVMFFGLSVSAFANHEESDPACAAIVTACKGAGYEPGEHKKNHKGLWVDCVGKIAKGKTVEGVSNTKEEARACMKAKHHARKHK